MFCFNLWFVTQVFFGISLATLVVIIVRHFFFPTPVVHPQESYSESDLGLISTVTCFVTGVVLLYPIVPALSGFLVSEVILIIALLYHGEKNPYSTAGGIFFSWIFLTILLCFPIAVGMQVLAGAGGEIIHNN